MITTRMNCIWENIHDNGIVVIPAELTKVFKYQDSFLFPYTNFINALSYSLNQFKHEDVSIDTAKSYQQTRP